MSQAQAIPATPREPGSPVDVHVTLTQLKRGQTAVIASASLHHDDEAMLAAMGLRAEARVQVCRSGQPCIVRVMGSCGLGCRIGLARPIASQIMVRPDADGAPLKRPAAKRTPEKN